jgi:hypothetical protein
MALVLLSNAKRLERSAVDANATSVEHIASEQVRLGFFRQVYLVTFWLKESKGFVRAVAIGEWEHAECSSVRLLTVEEDLR